MNTKTIALALILAAVSPAAFADRKSDLEAQAQQAAREKRLDAAADAYCELAKFDSSKKSDCDAARQVAANESRRNDDRFQKGAAFFKQGTLASMDDAEQQLKNIHFGPHLNEAQDYLRRIPGERRRLQDAQNRPPQPAQPQQPAGDQTYSDAVQAYNANNFDTAKTLFQQVKGAHQQDAQNYINKINQYQSAMAECNRLASATPPQHRAAQSACEDAARIKPDGPGNPTQRAQVERDAANQPAQPAQVAGGNTPAPQAPSRPEPQPPRQERTGAIKEQTAPKVDIDKTLREADAARAKGDKQTAKTKYVAALAADPGNERARKALDEITNEEQAQPQAQQAAATPSATPEADVMLARAIGEYYRGLYIDAEGHIKDYQNVNGSKKALGYFYSGVSKLTRYFLGGETDKKLLNDAEAALRIAKSTSGFKAPGEDYVSPRVLKVFNSL
jgi:hypothetical protein